MDKFYTDAYSDMYFNLIVTNVNARTFSSEFFSEHFFLASLLDYHPWRPFFVTLWFTFRNKLFCKSVYYILYVCPAVIY